MLIWLCLLIACGFADSQPNPSDWHQGVSRSAVVFAPVNVNRAQDETRLAAQRDPTYPGGGQLDRSAADSSCAGVQPARARQAAAARPVQGEMARLVRHGDSRLRLHAILLAQRVVVVVVVIAGEAGGHGERLLDRDGALLLGLRRLGEERDQRGASPA
jgi:hypothetical protein